MWSVAPILFHDNDNDEDAFAFIILTTITFQAGRGSNIKMDGNRNYDGDGIHENATEDSKVVREF